MGSVGRGTRRVVAWLGARLSWTPVRSTGWTYEAAILRVLRANEAIDLDRVVEIVAAEAIRQESGAGAWTTDIGIWGPSLCRELAVTAVRRMLGRSLVLEASGDGRGIVVPVASA